MFCTKCGQKLKDGSNFCTNCGAIIRSSPLNAEPDDSGKAPVPPAEEPSIKEDESVHAGNRKKSPVKYILLVLAAVVLFLAAFVSVYYLINGEIPFISLPDSVEGTKHSDHDDEPQDEDSPIDEVLETPDANTVDAAAEAVTQEESAAAVDETEPSPSDEAAPSVLFSADAAYDVAAQTILGSTINEAAASGWVNQWIRLYYYGDTDEQSEAAQRRTGGVSMEEWLKDYVTYDSAKDAGWGDAWLTLSVGQSSGASTAVAQSVAYDRFLDFVNNCDTRYFTRADLNGFDANMAIFARNAPYAHAGRKFTTDSIRVFFEQFGWYYPLIEANAFQETMLNEYETANKTLVVEYEREMGYK